MTIYTVGIDGDFRTLAAAAKAVQPGDVVNILSGIYKEKLIANVADVTWQPAEGAEVVIDGGWNGQVIKGFMNQVAATGPGVVIRGLTVRNSPGRGIAALADGVQVIGNRIDRTYHGGMIAGDAAGKPVSNLLIEGNICTRMSQSFVTETGFDNVNGSFNILNVRDSVVRGNILSDGWGEGINVGRGSMRVLVEGNTVHTMNHGLMYFNHCIDCVATGNFLYHIPDPEYRSKDGNYSAGVIIGDERTINAKFPAQKGNRFTGNLVVGAGTLLHVRNGSNPERGYNTQLNEMVIANNTFVAGPGTRAGIRIDPNVLGRPHQGSEFRDNAVFFLGAQADAPIGAFSGPGVEFHHNGWSEQPPANMRGEGDVYEWLLLADPAAAIARTGQLPETTFNRDHYRPAALSPLIGRSSEGATIGALAAASQPPDEPPVDPPDPPVTETERILEELGIIAQGVGLARLEIDQALARLAQLSDSIKDRTSKR